IGAKLCSHRINRLLPQAIMPPAAPAPRADRQSVRRPESGHLHKGWRVPPRLRAQVRSPAWSRRDGAPGEPPARVAAAKGPDLRHSTNGRNARSEPGTLEMPRDLIAHDCCLLAHLHGKRITALTRSLVHHDRDWRLQRVCEVANVGARACDDLSIRLDKGICF